MLQNAYLLAKIGADTAENEQHFAKKLPKIGNYPPKGTEARSGTGAPRSCWGAARRCTGARSPGRPKARSPAPVQMQYGLGARVCKIEKITYCT